jgi:hypothetical protein
LINYFKGEEKVMMSFDEREKAYEAQFAHREEFKFKVRGRAIRLLALWSAERLGRSSQAGEAYAREIVAVDVTSSNPDVAIGRVVADLGATGISEQEVRQTMDRFLVQADVSLRGLLS